MRGFFLAITRNAVSLVGAIVTTVSAIVVTVLFGIQSSGFRGGPYLGIITYLVVPAFFVLGLLLIPVGRFIEARRALRAAGEGRLAPVFPVIDLNSERTRRMVLVFLALTAINIVIVAVATYNAVRVMDSSEFCGEACHSVMSPEYTAYRRSPHARVECVDCHIGPGASWFVRSKLSGTWQLVSVVFDLYDRPIPTPVHSLRPARDTCEHCHWPVKYVGDRLRVRTHYDTDEASTERKTVLLVKVGGMQGQRSRGIHWHVDPGVTIEYTADERREHIHRVVLTRPDGSTTVFASDEPIEGETVTRVMDCVDCHNRPTHVYLPPERALDEAILEGRIPRELPYVKREALAALTEQEYASRAEARAAIAERLRAFYEREYPEIAREREALVEQAIEGTVEVYTTNVFPEMKVGWDTYPNHLGHQDGPESGCFRCHNGKLRSEDGRSISQGCTTCHSLLAIQQEQPEILSRLNP